MRSYRQRRRDKGLCAECGMPSPRTFRCQECADKNTAKIYTESQSAAQRIRRELRKKMGLCVMCAEPVERFVRCLVCRIKIKGYRKGRKV